MPGRNISERTPSQFGFVSESTRNTWSCPSKLVIASSRHAGPSVLAVIVLLEWPQFLFTYIVLLWTKNLCTIFLLKIFLIPLHPRLQDMNRCLSPRTSCAWISSDILWIRLQGLTTKPCYDFLVKRTWSHVYKGVKTKHVSTELFINAVVRSDE